MFHASENGVPGTLIMSQRDDNYISMATEITSNKKAPLNKIRNRPGIN